MAAGKDDKIDLGKIQAGEKNGQGGGKKSLLLWASILLVGILVAAGAGFGTGKMVQAVSAGSPNDSVEDVVDEGAPAGEYSYFEFNTVTVSLRTPRGDRYLRATVLLKVPAKYYPGVEARLNRAMPELMDWLIGYLGNHDVSGVLGEKAKNRMAREIREHLNSTLWPRTKPRIERVLFKDFVLQ